ncbi:hypothetical protein [Parvularcula lutaonensis]|uniref:Lipoprotein n=1 Tax=Parvularcula lutaonensis TaxID=491923 RepID=A0ABV7MA97_9PROT|nr:hypothetical protein [Parvularcula lutaonensis]GGY47314.1 hypothetical protein GCM10007148_15790 [Parvularcula lutaonensis]
MPKQSILISALLLGACDGTSLSGKCGHDIRSAVTSPDGAFSAAIDIVDCGATTDYATWILVDEAGNELGPDDRFAVFEGQSGSIEWTSSRALTVYGGEFVSLDESHPQSDVLSVGSE